MLQTDELGLRNPARWIYDQTFGRLRLDRKVYVSLAVGLLVLVAVGLIAYGSIDRLVRSEGAVVSAQSVLGQMELVTRLLMETEAAQRAYLLTGDPEELRKFHQAAAAVDAELAELEAGISDPEQLRLLAESRPLIRQRLAALASAIATWQAGGLDAAAEQVRRGGGRALMRQVRDTFGRMAARELQVVQERTKQARRTARFAERTIIAAILVVLALFAAAASTIGRELRERRAAEAAATQLARIVESSGDAIFSTTPAGEITTWNNGAERLFGYEVEQAVGRPLSLLVSAARQEEAYGHLAAMKKGAVVEDIDSVWQRRDGSPVDVALSMSAIRSEGHVIGASVIARDITARREVERMKNEFVSVVSHELRTPLTSIRGALGLLSGGLLGQLPEKGQRMLEVATTNTDRLIRLINDILDIEKIEAGEIAMQRRPVEAAPLLEEAAAEMRAMAEKAGVELITRPAAAAVMADPDRILQVLTNLLSNAIKFSDAGTAVTAGVESAGGEVRFSVRDQGRGIPPEKSDLIFERFQQVDASDSREKGGTGLGLAICRGIVQQHGGRIWVESEPGRGSTFCFTLPAAVPDTAGVPPRAPAPARPIKPRVLLCDDDETVLNVIARLLERRGYDVLQATSGAQAIELAAAQRPAAVLLDLVMPGMSGWDTLAALKARRDTSDIPVIIFSALGPDPQDSRGRHAAGWLVKTADMGALLETLETHTSGSTVPRVLVVEDDEDLARILCETFEQQGFDATRTSSGAEAIEIAQQFDPSIVVLDLALADGEGDQVVDWLRQHRLLRHVPLIVYTARELTDQDREQLKLGVTELFTKARATPEDLAERAAVLLGRITARTVETGANGGATDTDHRG